MRAPENAVSVQVGLRWSDQDPNRHLNNANVVTILEEGRVRASDLLVGHQPSKTQPRVVRSMHVSYDHEVLYAPEVEVKVWISHIGNTSFEVSHELIQNGTSCVYGTSRIVSLDPETRRPTPLTPAERERMNKYLHTTEQP